MRRLGLALIVLVLTGIWPPHAGVDAQAAELPLQACLAQHRSLSALFLVDTSRSLTKTDPDAQRVTGLQAAVKGLASLRDSQAAVGQPPLDVQIGFLSFGSDTTPSFTDRESLWQDLTDPADTIAQLDQFRGFNQSQDTDYVSALQPFADPAANTTGELGALEALEGARPDSCRLLVWFTDGEFDFDYPPQKTLDWANPPIQITNRDATVTAVEAGRSVLCDANGLADRLRTGDIANGSGAQVAVVALGSSNFDLMQRIADGTGGCGQLPGRGRLYAATDVSDLILNLREAVLGLDQGDPTGTTGLGSCGEGDECAYDYPFQLTGAIRSFNLLTIAGDPTITARLIAPDGTVVPLDGDVTTTLANGVGLNVDQFDASPGTHQVDATLPPDRPEWMGLWRVRFVTTDPSLADELINRASIYVFGGELQAELRDDQQFVRRGRNATFVVEPVNAGGVIATGPDFVPKSVLTLAINGTPVAVPEQASDGTWTVSYDVPESVQDDHLVLTATVASSIRLTDSSLTLPVTTSLPQQLGSIEVRDLPHYPVIDDPVGAFDVVDQDHLVVSSTLEVDASAPESGGCIRLDRADPPRSHGYDVHPTVRVTDGGQPVDIGKDCAIQLQAGETRTLDVTVSFDRQNLVEHGGAVSGHLDGDLAFTSVSELDPTQTATFTKPYGVATNPIVVVVNPDAKTLTAAFVLAALLPFLIMYLLNFLGRKIDVGPAGFVELPVRYDRGLLTRIGGTTSGVTIVDDDVRLVEMPPEGRYGRVAIGGVEFQGHMPASPFADVSGRAVAGGAALVVSAKGSTKKGDAGKLEATLSKGRELGWAFRTSAMPERRSPDSDETDLAPVDGTLTMLVPRRPDAARDYVASRIHELTEDIGDAVRTHAIVPTPPPPPDPETPIDDGGARGPGDPDPFGDSTVPRPIGASVGFADPLATSTVPAAAQSGLQDPFSFTPTARTTSAPPSPRRGRSSKPTPPPPPDIGDPFGTH